MKNVKHLLPAIILLGIMHIASTCKPREEQDNVLVFSKTAGYRHTSIAKGAETIDRLGQTNGFTVAHSEDASLFTAENLKQFKAVVFLNTTGNILSEQQKGAFKAYVNQGGGFVGIHAATDTEYNWPWYNQLVGAYFSSHPEVQEAKLTKTSLEHPATRHLPATWLHTDEWYNFKDINPQIQTLLLLEESSYSGGENGDTHPITWYHAFDGGRSFYTGMGHTDESYDEKEFQQLLLGGMRYAMGKD